MRRQIPPELAAFVSGGEGILVPWDLVVALNGDYVAAAMLKRILFWWTQLEGILREDHRWISLSRHELASDLHLSIRQARTALDAIVKSGAIVVGGPWRFRSGPPKLHYRPDLAVLTAWTCQDRQEELSIPTTRDVDSDKSYIRGFSEQYTEQYSVGDRSVDPVPTVNLQVLMTYFVDTARKAGYDPTGVTKKQLAGHLQRLRDKDHKPEKVLRMAVYALAQENKPPRLIDLVVCDAERELAGKGNGRGPVR